MMRIFLFLKASRPVLDPARLPVQWVLGAVAIEAKRLEREADHPLLSSVEVNAWSYTSTPTVRIHVVMLN
jgi:hypothetical protein